MTFIIFIKNTFDNKIVNFSLMTHTYTNQGIIIINEIIIVIQHVFFNESNTSCKLFYIN